ncbi:RNA polymerase sigma factor [Mangrovibacterium marinum]|uniref:RNA polymerase sigma-70 factor (ECF subfamily) n=1 Tax=Mangrovibacterium marinum TaxID=1639118 RepID=A0A2T5C3N7_9BACT|nr:RNA polymerase sigma factor [Mangrovibacterium marinum]PTN09374.1 RNA polymerase sigma-70 factor (ECF subfamily) [Mangrovibacterium marinum]
METQYKNIHQSIIDQCKAGNREAQFELYKLYYKSMYNTSLRIVGNCGDAEDVMQESFLSVFNKLDSYEGKVSFGAWFKKIVVNRSLDYLKKRKVVFEEIDERVMDEEANPQMEIRQIDLNKLKQAIMKLPEGYRVVLSLYLLEGYDHDEIAEILHVSNVSSRTQLSRAKRKLRDLLVKDELFSFN